MRRQKPNPNLYPYTLAELKLLAQLPSGLEKEPDIHRRAIAEILRIDPKDVTDKQRRAAKAVNFGVVYGTRQGLGEKAKPSGGKR